MVLQTSIVNEISEYVEKLPKDRQVKLLNDLKKETQPKRKKVTQKQIMELSKEINKSTFEKYTKPRLVALNILAEKPKKARKYRTKDEAIKAISKKAKANITKKHLKDFLA